MTSLRTKFFVFKRFVRANYSGFFSTAAFVIAVLSLLVAWRSAIVSNKTFNNQFNVFWDLRLTGDAVEFVGLGQDKLALNTRVFFPEEIHTGFYLVYDDPREFNLKQVSPKLIENLKKLIGDDGYLNNLNETYLLPIGIVTRYVASGEQRIDASIYMVTYTLKSQGPDVVIDYLDVNFGARIELTKSSEPDIDKLIEILTANYIPGTCVYLESYRHPYEGCVAYASVE